MFVSTSEHYDLLIQENHDPVFDSSRLVAHMNKWDGPDFINSLEININSSVLEIGIGTGRLAQKVLKIGCKNFTGIDMSLLSIEKAKHNLREWNNVCLIHDGFMNYRFSTKFDIIYSSLVFMHIEDKYEAIKKSFDLLNCSGVFVSSFSKKQDTTLIYGNHKVKLYPDIIDDIRVIYNKCGFQITKIIETEFANIIVASHG
jgi:ubiquinone/menaquinone biosynthesis C-methylase UbiE